MTNLTDRMRTCAAHIMRTYVACDDDKLGLAIRDAADLLIAAATEIEILAGPIAKGEPMEIIPPIVAQPQPPDIPTQVWTDLALPTLQRGGTISPRACPVCDSRANKTVRRVSCAMMISCQVCGHEWEFKR